MIKQFIADAFTDKVFHGNPAAICLPERWPDERCRTSLQRTVYQKQLLW
ncbi:hypothetical protein [Parasutterella sp.]